MKTITLICENCKINFERLEKLVKADISRRKQTKFFCSKTCFDNFQRENKNSSGKFVILNCGTCKRNFRRKEIEHKASIRRAKKKERPLEVFCSRQCSTIYVASILKKVKIVCCKKCSTEFQKIGFESYCQNCINSNEIPYKRNLLKLTKKEAGHRVARNSSTRIMRKSSIERACFICGFNKFVEVCHIRAISDFPDETLLEVINNLNNLIYLCPNCHWELDHEFLCIYRPKIPQGISSLRNFNLDAETSESNRIL